MKKIILIAAGAIALVGTAAAAQPYGYQGYGHDTYSYGDGYQRQALRDSDRDGIPDVREWNQDRDHDGRPDQYDRYDNRRDRHHRWHARAYYAQPAYGYNQGYGERGRYEDQRTYSYRAW